MGYDPRLLEIEKGMRQDHLWTVFRFWLRRRVLLRNTSDRHDNRLLLTVALLTSLGAILLCLAVVLVAILYLKFGHPHVSDTPYGTASNPAGQTAP